jgi:hypothetical protein
MSKIDSHMDGSWELFEQWIRNTIGSDFLWRVRPMDKRSNREMIAKIVQNDMKANDGVFPERNAFIERK